MGTGQVEREVEALEIRFQILEVRVAMVELPVGGELFLDQHPERRSDLRGDDLRAFRVKVPAEPLEVAAYPEHVPSQVFIDQLDIRGHHRQGSGALEVELL
jgi:hypothetical protein